MEPNIKDSISKLLSVKEDHKIVDEFARGQYGERFGKSDYINGGWRAYKGFEILSDDRLKINFEYGGGDMEFDDNFIVKL